MSIPTLVFFMQEPRYLMAQVRGATWVGRPICLSVRARSAVTCITPVAGAISTTCAGRNTEIRSGSCLRLEVVQRATLRMQRSVIRLGKITLTGQVMRSRMKAGTIASSGNAGQLLSAIACTPMTRARVQCNGLASRTGIWALTMPCLYASPTTFVTTRRQVYGD